MQYFKIPNRISLLPYRVAMRVARSQPAFPASPFFSFVAVSLATAARFAKLLVGLAATASRGLLSVLAGFLLFLSVLSGTASAIEHYQSKGPVSLDPSDALLRDGHESSSSHISIIMNDSVEEFIERYTREKTTFQHGLNNAMPYLPRMKEIFSEERLPEELVYVVMVESLFDPSAVSGAHAAGIWQFMPGTARAFGLRNDRWVDERKDYLKSTRAAARYFKALYARLQSWPLVMAAYNAGMSTVRRAITLAGSGDFWNLKHSAVLNRETKTYVPKVMAAAIIARDPEAYGFRIPKTRPLRFDVIELTKSTNLRTIARDINCPLQRIKALNPEIKRGVTPPRAYLLKIPEGKRKLFITKRGGAGTRLPDLSRLSRPSLPVASFGKEA